jgi:sugar O-acyltransferase (sialic acid O-acetyltransferase NeuD family)
MSEPAPLLILGAGGHGRVVADAALRAQRWGAISATSRWLDRSGDLLPGVRLEAFEPAIAAAAFVHVAIGDAADRRKESEAIGAARLATVVHPESSVSTHSEMAQGCFVAARAVVGPLARLERGAIVNHGAIVDHDSVVGAFSHVAINATLAGAVRLGEGVLVGAGAAVLPGRKVCDGAVIGAGAVVTQDILEPGVYAGVPARRIR